MYFSSKKISLLILAITAIGLSRLMFFFFNDPEGPNLLIVMVTAAIVYAVSLAIYAFCFATKQDGLKKLLVPIFIQIMLVAGLYFLSR